MSLDLLISYLIVGLLWLSFLIVFIVTYYLSPTEELEIFYDNCTEADETHKYLIRFIFSYAMKGFTPTDIYIQIFGKKTKPMAKFVISKNTTQRYQRSPIDDIGKVVKLLLITKKSLEPITNVVINHRGQGGLGVISVEIQEINSNLANIAFVGQDILNLTEEEALVKQCFPSRTKEHREIEEELHVSHLLTIYEHFVFIFIAINFILFLCVFLIPCRNLTLVCDNFTSIYTTVLSGVISTIISSLIYIFLIIIYRYFVKTLFVEEYQKQNNKNLKNIYLLSLLVFGVIIGSITAIIVSMNTSSDTTSKISQQFYWAIASAEGIIIFFIIFLPLIFLFGSAIGFFRETKVKRTSKRGY